MNPFSSEKERRELEAYEQVAAEIADGIKREGLWLKAMSDSDFDAARARSIYVKLRVREIMDTAPSAASASSSQRSQRQSSPAAGNKDIIDADDVRPRSRTKKGSFFGYAKPILYLILGLSTPPLVSYLFFAMEFNFNVIGAFAYLLGMATNPAEFGDSWFYISLVSVIVSLVFTAKGISQIRRLWIANNAVVSAQ